MPNYNPYGSVLLILFAFVDFNADGNSKGKTGTNMEQAKKFLSECQEPLDKYAKQLGNISRIFPTVEKINVTVTTENVHNFTGINPTNPIIKNSSSG